MQQLNANRYVVSVNGNSIQFDTTGLWSLVYGIAILHLVIFGIIWIIPEGNRPRPRRKIPQAEEDLSEEQKEVLKDGTYEKK